MWLLANVATSQKWGKFKNNKTMPPTFILRENALDL
jgi:hypothetical protein